MKVVNPNNTTHSLKLVPRFNPTLDLTLYIYDEYKCVDFLIENNTVFVDGFLYIDFDFNFTEDDKFQIKILENDIIIYRGKLIATEKDTQTFLKDSDQYYYE